MKLNEMVIVMRNGSIETAEIAEEIGMLNIETGMYYILNGIGTEIWKVIEHPMTIDELVTQLMTIYDVDRELCLNETLEFLTELIDNALVEVVN